jgi:hypothetical protein
MSALPKHAVTSANSIRSVDLIFGAVKLNLKIVEVPVRYADRTYGETQISRFRDGWLLLRMVALAWRKLKAL